jgi:hypothetical protein
MDFMFSLFYDHACRCAQSPFKGVAHPEIRHDLEELQARFVYRALYELRIEE